MIGIGLVALTGSFVQHGRALRRLRAECPGLPVSLSRLTSGLLLVLGALAAVGALQG